MEDLHFDRNDLSRRETAAYWLVTHGEQIAALLLLLWCLLPFFMSAYDLLMGAFGAFPIVDERFGTFNYRVALKTYYTAFCVLGGITFFFAVLSIMLCWTRVWDRRSLRHWPSFYLLAFFLAWALISALLSRDFAVAFFGGNYMHDGYMSYLIYAGVFLCASMIRQERIRRTLLRTFCSATVWLSALMLLQETEIHFLDYCFPALHSVVFNNSNHLGYVLCMAVTALTGLYLFGAGGRGEKALELVGIALLFYTVLINNTFGAEIGIVFGLAVVYVFFFRRGGAFRLAVLLPLAIIAALLLLNLFGLTPGAPPFSKNLVQSGTDLQNILNNAEAADHAGSGRMILWKQTLAHIAEKPLFGYGPEGFYGDAALNRELTPHNEYLQIAGYLGLPALCFYLTALLTLALRQWKRLKRLSPLTLAVSAVTVAYLVSAFVGNPVFNTAPFFWMFLGLTTDDGEPPLLSMVEAATAERLLAEADRKRILGKIIPIASVLVLLTAGFSAYLLLRSENDAEYADLQCMFLSQNLARLMDREEGSETLMRYWFDSESFSLISAEEPMPEPYGLGTSRRGGALQDFRQQNEGEYAYDEGTDYRDKVLLVTVIPGASGEPDVNMEWVDYVR